jgi:hypothetical protein
MVLFKLATFSSMGEERKVYKVFGVKARRKETTWKTKA